MKHLILLVAFFVVLTTKLYAQDNDQIKIINLEKGVITNNDNSFKIVAHEGLDIDLKIFLKKFDSYQVLVTNGRGQTVYAKLIAKEGKNLVSFTADEGEHYTVKLINEKKNEMMAASIKK